MRERLRAGVLRLLRVPPEPEPPAGDPAALRVFRASPRYYRYHLLLWALAQAGTLIGLAVGLYFLQFADERIEDPLLLRLVQAAEAIAWAAYLLQLPVSFAMLRLDYEQRWYMLTDRALRIREGLVSVREKTMTFANVQQISVRQNPLQQLLGLADVQVRSAGGGSGSSSGKKQIGESLHEARFRGVDNAEQIRDAIRERVRQHRDTGLGDPDEPHPSTRSIARPRSSAAALEAAHEVLAEVRAMRAGLAGGDG